MKKGSNLPNQITIARIVVIPAVMFFILYPMAYGEWIAAAVFLLAAATDGLDGYLARAYEQVTVFGQFLDPLADKLLVSAALISLVSLGDLSPWIAVIIIGREFAVTALRLVAADRGEIIPAGSLGKIKTVAQVTAITLFIMPGEVIPGPIGEAYFAFKWTIMIIATALTVYSGLDYFRKAQTKLYT